MTPRILVAGIGNIFLGDDGFGPEVLRHLGDRLTGHEGVRVSDYGIGGLHLAYDLLEEWDALVLVDALPDRGAPGTVHVFEADDSPPGPLGALDAHGMDPATVFASLRALGGSPPRTIVVGCQVADVSEGLGLSEPVRAAVPEAVTAVESVVAMLQHPDRVHDQPAAAIPEV
ncbi:MAG: hydrogenase maturation protease [Mycobacterium sp.]|uniref:hydrogenase maturation protease n=1 Tax=Mycobacterium sp. TaxID=1785 RepID=UPI0026084EDA|nr:hydrogenase maturation protease [Mycobacterium sp.]MDI3314176.1 hydrogenase maturation protease [Mycobacterium sp.]